MLGCCLSPHFMTCDLFLIKHQPAASPSQRASATSPVLLVPAVIVMEKALGSSFLWTDKQILD